MARSKGYVARSILKLHLLWGRDRQVAEVQEVLVTHHSWIGDWSIVLALDTGSCSDDLIFDHTYLFSVKTLHLFELVWVLLSQIYDGLVHHLNLSLKLMTMKGIRWHSLLGASDIQSSLRVFNSIAGMLNSTIRSFSNRAETDQLLTPDFLFITLNWDFRWFHTTNMNRISLCRDRTDWWELGSKAWLLEGLALQALPRLKTGQVSLYFILCFLDFWLLLLHLNRNLCFLNFLTALQQTG